MQGSRIIWTTTVRARWIGERFGRHRLAGGMIKAWVYIAAVLSVMLAANLASAQQTVFDFARLTRIAREAAEHPFVDESKKVPDFLLKLDYDHWRDIRFRKEDALWRTEGLPFTIEFFHLGFYYNLPVHINVVTDKQVVPIRFSTQLFTYGKNDFAAKIPENLGFAGFRIQYPINRKDYYDEVAVFLGASYFRAVARGLNYGLSARGLAIDTAVATGEEFPYFKEFWLVKPKPAANYLTVYALLDSRSLTGAYEFVIRPGKETIMDVALRLFPRQLGKKIGLAPLTSMYYYSETTNQRPSDDYRPEVHDSDGLLLAYPTGEFVWRQLINPKRLFVNAFKMPKLVGFGLLQRDMNFDHYQDLQAHYEKRPSVWVRPLGQWGPGHVELVQIPIKSEKNDNIVAYWVSDRKFDKKGSPLYRYRLSWYAFKNQRQHQGGYVASTRTAAGKDDNHRKFIVDFKGGVLDKLPSKLPANAPLDAVIWVDDKAEVTDKQLFQLPGGGWRLVFQIKLKDNNALKKILPDNHSASPVEMRAYLKQGENVQTETWSYAYWF
jgi:glucans biosynthesis protein